LYHTSLNTLFFLPTANDGSTLRGNTAITCTRWAELEETVNFHAEFAAAVEATSVFRLLNDPGPRAEVSEFSVGGGGAKFAEEEVQTAKRIMRACQP
jgi:hypothetical protein